jgi:hypothetical protein
LVIASVLGHYASDAINVVWQVNGVSTCVPLEDKADLFSPSASYQDTILHAGFLLPPIMPAATCPTLTTRSTAPVSGPALISPPLFPLPPRQATK